MNKGFLLTLFGDNRRRRLFVVTVAFAFSVCLCTSGWAEVRIDPFAVRFTPVQNNNGKWTDLNVVLNFSVFNEAGEDLSGEKFLCLEDISSVSVTDKTGRQLAFSLKAYPRKKIEWQYPPADEDGRRTVKIAFTAKNIIKEKDDRYVVFLDWIGGWTVPVQHAAYRFMLPDAMPYEPAEIYPEGYRQLKSKSGTIILHTFARLKKDPLKIILATKGLSRAKNKGASHAQKSNTEILSVRYGRRSKSDRIVFTLNRDIPYQLKTHREKKEFEISWNMPLKVPTPLKSTIKAGRFIKEFFWKKKQSAKTSCIVRLNTGAIKVKSMALKSPYRVFVDVSLDESKDSMKKNKIQVRQESSVKRKRTRRQKNEASKKAISHKAKTEVQSDKSGKKVEVKKNAVSIGAESKIITRDIVENSKDSPLSGEKDFQNPYFEGEIFTNPEKDNKARKKVKPPPEGENGAYKMAENLFRAGNYKAALSAYKDIMKRFPGTSFKEHIEFKIADCYFNVAEKEGMAYFQHAADAYHLAILHFPSSKEKPRATFQIAECYRRCGHYLEAKNQYLLFCRRYPKNPLFIEARYLTAECFYQMRKYELAREEFENFIKDFPTGPHLKQASFRIADCYAQLKDFERAEYYYKKAMERWPGIFNLSMDTLNGLGEVYYHKGQFEQCRELLLLSFNIYPHQQQKDKILRLIGDAYQWQGKMKQALVIYAQVVKNFPDTFEGMRSMMRMADIGVNTLGLEAPGLWSANQIDPYRNPDEAYQWIVKNDTTGELLEEALYKLGFIYAKKQRYEESLEFFERALNRKRLSVYYEKSLKNIQKILSKMIEDAFIKKDYFSVIALYRENYPRYLSSAKNDKIIYYVGHSYLEMGFLNEAEELLSKLSESADEQIYKEKSIIELSHIDLRRGDTRRAEGRLAMLSCDSSGSFLTTGAYHLLGDIYFKKKNFKKAIDFYTVALSVHEGQENKRIIKTLFYMGKAFGKTGLYYNGINALRKLVSKAKDTIQDKEVKHICLDAKLLMAEFLAYKNNYKAAIKVYQSAVKNCESPDYRGWALFKMGECLLKTGDEKNSQEIFSEITEKMPSSFWGRLAQRQLKSMEWEQEFGKDLKQST